MNTSSIQPSAAESAQITEAQVVSFLSELARKAASNFGGYGSFEISATVYTHSSSAEINCMVGAGGLNQNYGGRTVADAFAKAGGETPAAVAAKKRAEAARLMAEADRLTAAATTQDSAP